ncbi:type I-E CRISPR-associated protein Cas6/Cse3/CasE [Wenjunlia tyrosinilytica]|uniref:Type I-E CRISPR-associated protein Cas6/Cse3/CasE n=1 Tax=Wenjunlia tyrosinilytica TaxID=1544741 RepID=A0A917ZXN9_9ACTN|nr:type I-E CRISPR-associated protein Cas6/Cse3/CasE [Wenjunlia tyrosinilytica]GGO99239.1 type I-E CRISPR-associated protein Cas6/Cse3/CasE [Wenjunlia tyrosinilytica]
MNQPRAFLARIDLNLQDRAVQRDLRDANQMHKTLMRMVPDGLGPQARRITGMLYRLDTVEHGTILMVQASNVLDTSRLPDRYGRTQTRDLTPMFTALRKGLGVRYRIVVNPVKRERLPLERKDQRGRIVPLTGADADQWWIRRAADAGLELHTLTPAAVPAVLSRTTDASGMRHSLLRFDGTATVTDPAALTEALLSGIGRGKAYGAGLLSLAPAHTA